MVDWLVGCLVDWLDGCVVGWMIGWLVGVLVDWLVGPLDICSCLSFVCLFACFEWMSFVVLFFSL